MTDPLQALLATLPATALPPTSRYAATPTTSYNGTPYFSRRFCPPSAAPRYAVTITDNDRRDRLAATHLGDPLMWWRLADANGALDPRELTSEPGRRISIV
jgi:hypothetical protein